jgi:hypothetical protein
MVIIKYFNLELLAYNRILLLGIIITRKRKIYFNFLNNSNIFGLRFNNERNSNFIKFY